MYEKDNNLYLIKNYIDKGLVIIQGNPTYGPENTLTIEKGEFVERCSYMNRSIGGMSAFTYGYLSSVFNYDYQQYRKGHIDYDLLEVGSNSFNPYVLTGSPWQHINYLQYRTSIGHYSEDFDWGQLNTYNLINALTGIGWIPQIGVFNTYNRQNSVIHIKIKNLYFYKN